MADESCPDQGDHLAEVLDNLRISGDMTDIILVCEEKEFEAHKLMLYAVSDYFKGLLKSEWRDNNGRFELPTVTADEMGIILPFLYTGKVKEVNDPDLIKELLKTSHMMQIDGLFQYCYKKLCDNLDCNNFLEIYNLACLYKHSSKTELVVFLKKHFVDISRSEEFKQLNPDQILKIVQNVAINDDVIEALLKWAEAEEDREGSLLHILTSVGLQNVTIRYLMKLISERILVMKNVHILTFFTKATARIYFENVLEDKLICCDGNRCRMFDIRQNKWLAPKILPFTLELGMTTVAFEEHVYFVGGGDDCTYKPTTEVIKYNPALNLVVSKGKLSMPVSGAGLGVLFNCIYVVNGVNQNGDTVRTVQRYNPATKTCGKVANTHRAHFLPTVFSFSNYLHVVGCCGENSVERYDHETDAWATITNIPGTIEWCSAAIIKERMFVSSSHNSNAFQVYDLASNTWVAMKIEGLTSVIELFSTTFGGKSVLLIHDDHNVVRIYDDETKLLLTKSAAGEAPSWDFFRTCVS